MTYLIDSQTITQLTAAGVTLTEVFSKPIYPKGAKKYIGAPGLKPMTAIQPAGSFESYRVTGMLRADAADDSAARTLLNQALRTLADLQYDGDHAVTIDGETYDSCDLNAFEFAAEQTRFQASATGIEARVPIVMIWKRLTADIS